MICVLIFQNSLTPPEKRLDRILEKEYRPSTRQTRVLEKQTRRRPREKSDQSAADWVRSAAAAGGLGWPGLWIALPEIEKKSRSHP